MTQINRLTSRAVQSQNEPGLYPDGQGLYLRVGKGKRWVYIFHWRGKRREMGLGPASGANLAGARRAASKARESAKQGIDPINARNEERSAGVTFGEVADAHIALKEAGWRNSKHRQQWKNTLETYASGLRQKPVAEITTDDVLSVLRPIWTEKSETASRLRGRLENILDAAKAQRLRSGENPAAWRGNLAHLLPKRSKLSRGHQRAVPYERMPEFWNHLIERSGVAAKALQFTILTAARTSEVLGALWTEIDWTKGVWVVPANRTKSGEAHRVPLPPAALAILEALRPLGSTFIFPSSSKKPLSTAAMSAVLKRMKVQGTVHGFRSSFRDWAGDCSSHPREIVEAALAHKIGNAVERAYRRTDALEKRKSLMSDWADYLAEKGITDA